MRLQYTGRSGIIKKSWIQCKSHFVKYSKEIKVGFFSVLTIAMLYLGVNYLKGVDFFSSVSRYYVMYDDVGGLQVSNPVKINGFTVGRVSDISILQEKQNKILVEIEIKEEIILGDTTLALLDVEFLGAVNIILEVGDISNPLSSGDTLRPKLDQGLEDLLRSSALPVADNLQGTIRKINTFLDDLSGNLEHLGPALENISGAARNVKTITAGSNQEKLSDLLDNLNSTAVELKATIKKIDPLVQNFTQVADSLKSLQINETLAKMNTTLEGLDQTLTDIREGDGTISRLIKEDSLYVQLNQTLQNLDKLLIHFDEFPKDFLSPLGRSSKKIQKRIEKEGNN